MPPDIAGPHSWADKFVSRDFSDGFGQLAFVYGDPLANQLDGSFLIRFVCKEILHHSRFSLGIESRDPDVPSCWHRVPQSLPPRAPLLRKIKVGGGSMYVHWKINRSNMFAILLLCLPFLSGLQLTERVTVIRLMTRSNLVSCSTGMSAGFVPRRILSTYNPKLCCPSISAKRPAAVSVLC